MKKVCILFPYPMGDDFLSGGVSKLVVANLEAVKSNYEVSVMAPIDNAGFERFMADKYPDINVNLVDFLPLARFVDNKNLFIRVLAVAKRLNDTLRTNKNVRKAIHDTNPDIVHFHGEVTFPYLKYGKEIGAGTIFHTSCFRFSRPAFLKNMVVNRALRDASLIVSPTKSISDLFGNSDKNVILPNPIITVDGSKTPSETQAIEPSLTDFDGLKVMFVGRICRVKQIHYMVQALAALTENERRQVRFFVVGKPNTEADKIYHKEILDYIDEKDLGDSVVFLGYKNNADDYMKVADVGVLLSESEAISMAGIEYLFNHMPVIGFNNPGVNELFTDGLGGFLLEDGDVQGLAECLRKLADTELLRRMKDSAYEEALSRYSMEAFSSRLLSFYKRIERKC